MQEQDNQHPGNPPSQPANSASAPPVLTTKAGKPRVRMNWTLEMNTFIMRQYYLLTNNETNTANYRQELHAAFRQHYPHLDVTEQRIADQRRAITTKNYIPQTRLDDLKDEVAEILQTKEAVGRLEPERPTGNSESPPRLTPNDENAKDSEITTPVQQDDKLTVELATELQRAMVEYAHTDPTLRPRIPKQNSSRKLTICTKLMDERILPDYLEGIGQFLDLHTLIYAAAVAIVRVNGGKIGHPMERQYKPNSKPPWEQRLENAIHRLRTDIAMIYQYNSGKKSKKIERAIVRIRNRTTKHAERNPDNASLLEILDTLKQQLKAKAGRLRRYRESDLRKKQNKLFNSDQKTYYRRLRANQENAHEPPARENVENFWSSIWSQPVLHNNEASWITSEEKIMSDKPAMAPCNITTERVTESINNTQNWKAAGPDQIHNFWLKRFPSTHPHIAEYFRNFLHDPINIPAFLTQGTTYLLPKGGSLNDPANYRPITCLCTLYKILTACLSGAVYQHLKETHILAEEQKGCVKKSQGCKEQIIIDSVITEQAAIKRRNIYTAFIDYKKAFDSIPHSWLLRVLEIYKVDQTTITLLKHLMSSWSTVLQINHNGGKITSNPISIRRGIFQGDSLSPLWFCLALNPLSSLLNKTKYGFQLKSGTTTKYVISHLLYMDDIKLYAANENQLNQLLKVTEAFSMDIQMTFGLDKCKTLNINQGKITASGFQMVEGGTIEPMMNTDTYKYLGLIQARRLQHNIIKEIVLTEYSKRLSEILKSKLNGKNTFKAINTYAIPVLTYTFGTVRWTETDLENVQIKTRTTLTKFRAHHPKSAKERITLPRLKGGRGLIDVARLHQKQIKNLQHYFLSKRSPLHEAVTLADNRYTPLDLLHADEAAIPSEVTYEQGKIQAWKQKALHGRHPNELSHNFVDQEASNKWLTQADLFLETEGFMIAIQDQVIPTRNYRKIILKEANISDACRRCNEAAETIQHITAGCSMLAPTSYLQRHDQVASIVHQKLATLHKLSSDTSPYYNYQPANVLENDTHKLYWNRSILTDKSIHCNRPDITLTNKTSDTTYLVDIAIPNSHNLQSTWNEKMNKYRPLADEIKNIWKQKQVYIIPIIISATAIIPRNLHESLRKLQLHPSTYIQLQKSVVLNTTAIVRSHLNL